MSARPLSIELQRGCHEALRAMRDALHAGPEHRLLAAYAFAEGSAIRARVVTLGTEEEVAELLALAMARLGPGRIEPEQLLDLVREIGLRGFKKRAEVDHSELVADADALLAGLDEALTSDRVLACALVRRHEETAPGYLAGPPHLMLLLLATAVSHFVNGREDRVAERWHAIRHALGRVSARITAPIPTMN